MKYTDSQTLREQFTNFFERQAHAPVKSAGLVPDKDPTLLFVNAGMVPFKNVFLGQEKREYTRATSVQKCMRAGGKHNDLENVGYTARHHTFFEMLGNFSFGDYFKKDAINYAWTFLTKELNIPAEKLWVTVYEQDDEAADIWLKELKIDPNRFSRCGDVDNFWSMGETGPCGPCTEIFYDHGEQIPGGPPGSEEQDGDRYVEIWNLVFMQYNRDEAGSLEPLPKPSVDTGMGLERLAAVMQGTHDNYQTDLFVPLIDEIKKLATSKSEDSEHALKAIADHIRAITFLIDDGVLPSNEGRGYVLRRVIRRAIRHGKMIGIDGLFLYKLLSAVINLMGKAYPQIIDNQQFISQVIKQEEQLFSETLDQGLQIFRKAVEGVSGQEIPGDIAFKLYDTYGFPIDLTADIAKEKGLTIDMAGFERLLAEQRARSQKSSEFKSSTLSLKENETEFVGYQQYSVSTNVVELYKDNKPVEQINEGEKAVIILQETPFYAEGGGQVGDTGWLTSEKSSFEVTDTQKQGSSFLHIGELKGGVLKRGDTVLCKLDILKRQLIARNHSATHLLHAAIRNILGHQATQKGSSVDAERLRFDFAYPKPLTQEQLAALESQVNAQIASNDEVITELKAYQQAIKQGAVALFNEKYTEKVRVLSMGKFSSELCGGTHVKRTGEIGIFKITQETAVAAGIRRIEALTSQNAIDWVMQRDKQLLAIAKVLKIPTENVVDKVNQLTDQLKSAQRALTDAEALICQQVAQSIVKESPQLIGDMRLIVSRVEALGITQNKTLRVLLDRIKDNVSDAVIVLAIGTEEQAHVIVGITKALSKQVSAKNLIQHLAPQIDGKGGGRDDMAQAGGAKSENLNQALASVETWLEQQLVIKA